MFCYWTFISCFRNLCECICTRDTPNTTNERTSVQYLILFMLIVHILFSQSQSAYTFIRRGWMKNEPKPTIEKIQKGNRILFHSHILTGSSFAKKYSLFLSLSLCVMSDVRQNKHHLNAKLLKSTYNFGMPFRFPICKWIKKTVNVLNNQNLIGL